MAHEDTADDDFSFTDTQQLPTFHAPREEDPKQEYIIFIVDIDGRINGTVPTKTLHLYQPSLQISKSLELMINNTKMPSAKYAGPAPPVGATHWYTVLMYIQPDGYELPQEFEGILPLTPEARHGFDIHDFERAARLEDPVAWNYFRIHNEQMEEESLGSEEC